MGKENSIAPFPPPYVKPEEVWLIKLAHKLHNTSDIKIMFNELVKVIEHERSQCALLAHTAQLDNEWDGRTAYVIEQAIKARSEPFKPKPKQESQEHEESSQI